MISFDRLRHTLVQLNPIQKIKREKKAPHCVGDWSLGWTQSAIDGEGPRSSADVEGKSGFSRRLRLAALTEQQRKRTYWHLLITWPLGGRPLARLMDVFADGGERHVWTRARLRPPWRNGRPKKQVEINGHHLPGRT